MEPGTGIHVLEGGRPQSIRTAPIPFAGIDPLTGELAT